MTEPQAGVTITLLDVYREVTATRSDMVKVTMHMERVDQRNQNADAVHADHENRLRSLEKIDADGLHELYGRVGALERFRWSLTGALVALQVVLSVVEYFVVHH